MRNLLLAGAAALALFGAATSASAGIVTVDFSGFTAGTLIDDTYNSIGLDFSPDAYFLQCNSGCPAPNVNGWFAYNSGNAFTVSFSTAQTDVSFQGVSFSDTVASAYNSANVLVAQIEDAENFPVTQAVNHLTGADIRYIVFSGAGNGPAPTNLTFDSERPFVESGAPEPTTWALMMLGFGGLGGALRRRNLARALA